MTMLSIQNLSVSVSTEQGQKALVERINLEIPAENIVALVGGSGSGKTTTGLAILQLLASELKVLDGKILFQGKDLLVLSGAEIRKIRGKNIGMIFQEPLDAFNPVYTI
ncbi:MAG: ATP-binding cassette domain-containing protein, partial [Candidatus Omnitrophica bacterium]|nr:ATP-binding cassette domain-containing protein [Candidatus Omnitrophota bacterium]